MGEAGREEPERPGPRVLLVSYSLSGQSRKLVRAVAAGLRAEGVAVVLEDLRPDPPLSFPFHSVARTLGWMLATLARRRVAIAAVSEAARGAFDLVVLAGPTWSYNPSGPVLAFLDGPEAAVLGGRPVLAVISCRAYWRLHWLTLRRRIRACGGEPVGVWAFDHPVREPWRSAGVFLTIAGRNPRRVPLLGTRYRHYGHDHGQVEEAERRGRELGRRLRARRGVEGGARVS